jgi:hypothetical protein
LPWWELPIFYAFHVELCIRFKMSHTRSDTDSETFGTSRGFPGHWFKAYCKFCWTLGSMAFLEQPKKRSNGPDSSRSRGNFVSSFWCSSVHGVGPMRTPGLHGKRIRSMDAWSIQFARNSILCGDRCSSSPRGVTDRASLAASNPHASDSSSSVAEHHTTSNGRSVHCRAEGPGGDAASNSFS